MGPIEFLVKKFANISKTTQPIMKKNKSPAFDSNSNSTCNTKFATHLMNKHNTFFCETPP